MDREAKNLYCDTRALDQLDGASVFTARPIASCRKYSSPLRGTLHECFGESIKNRFPGKGNFQT